VSLCITGFEVRLPVKFEKATKSFFKLVAQWLSCLGGFSVHELRAKAFLLPNP